MALRPARTCGLVGQRQVAGPAPEHAGQLVQAGVAAIILGALTVRRACRAIARRRIAFASRVRAGGRGSVTRLPQRRHALLELAGGERAALTTLCELVTGVRGGVSRLGDMIARV